MKLTDNIYWYKERGFFDCNTYLIDDDIRCLVDPGNPKKIRYLLDEMKEDGFSASQIDLIINTHSHPDHARANRLLKEISNSKIGLSKEEEEFMDSFRFIQILSRLFGGGKVQG